MTPLTNTRKRLVKRGIIGASAILLLGVSRDGYGQGSDGIKKPNVMVMIDTSESMVRAMDGSAADCEDGDKGRWAILMEALTGSVNDLRCNSGRISNSPSIREKAVPIDSNGCRPYLNQDSSVVDALTAHPGAWPYMTQGNKEWRQTVVYCGKNNNSMYDNDYNTRCGAGSSWNFGELCKIKNKEWDQIDDGLIDTYSTQMRFGLMAFDGLSTTQNANNDLDYLYWYHAMNRVAGDVKYGQNDNCQLGTTGGRCYLANANTWFGSNYYGDPQFSYWFQANGNSWLNGNRAYGGYIVSENPMWSVTLTFPRHTVAESNIDIGVRNPLARPDQGRLIGFGAASWDFNDPGALGCSSEDDCTKLHNEMVQQAILGTTQTLARVPAMSPDAKAGLLAGLLLPGNHDAPSSTPIAAALRDAYEFFRYDNASVAVHVPHPHNVDPSTNSALMGKISPSQDPYYNGTANACRKQHIVLVTGGEPENDIHDRAASWAWQLNDDRGVKTYVLGTAARYVQWNRHWLGIGFPETKDCTTVSYPADFGSGEMCEPDPIDPVRFKYADPDYATLLSGSEPDKLRACCTLVETAYRGGTGKPYFPENASEVKQDLNKILSDISGELVSRTQPTFASAPRTFMAQATPMSVKGTYFELRSSVHLNEGDTMWRGNLERVRYACTTGASPVPTPLLVEASKGDRYQENVNIVSASPSRKFFTVAPLADVGNGNGDDDVTNYALRMQGSLRPTAGDPNDEDHLFNGGDEGNYRRFPNNTSDTTLDVPVDVDTLPSRIDGLTDVPKLPVVMGMRDSDKKACDAATGTNNLEQCADRVVKWFAGDDDPGGDTPSRLPGSSHCANSNNCSALGGIYHSSPVVVPPPQASDSDEQNFGRVRSNGEQSFFEQYQNRPMMAYQQTTDGQLHAFVLTMDDFDGGTNPDWDASASPTPVNKTDALRNNELWSFIPPAVMPSLFPNFNVQVRLLDGQLTWDNVVFERPFGENGGVSSTDGDNVNWDYRTVIVAASGESALGGFYYALDVTDPVKPRFLWQLSYAGNGANGEPGDRLFGKSAPGAAITHIRYEERDGRQKIVAVAVLPGGKPIKSAPVSVVDRRIDPDSYWDGSRKPRSRVRNWGTGSDLDRGEPSRSLTIVELSTGRILGRIVGDMADNPRDPSDATNLTRTILHDHVAIGRSDAAKRPFDSPITGVPVAYPAGIGKVADRVYVGDADGALWRIDLSSPDPDDWKARIAFDAYNRGTNSTLDKAYIATGPNKGNQLDNNAAPDDAALMGQPIQTAPVLSLDDSGNVVVTFTTGDQEEFRTVSDGMVNILASFPEVPKDDYPYFQATLDSSQGVEVAFQDGARVTGPLNLFDGQLYFAYFSPVNGGTCQAGKGGLCGFNYVRRESDVPIPATDLNPETGSGATICEDFSHGEVVFGVSINLMPSCTPTESVSTDPWLAGQYKSITQSNLGQYQLSYHTNVDGGEHQDAKTPNATLDLPAPSSKTRVRTWVSVVE
ncbi:MAG: hypothetical protein HOW73_03420 [Polyangiaceae bacterium]|nr:hypothetical protein [Polyangiaceae bacterium]